MAFRKRLSKEQIDEHFDHYGLMFGIVPVYIGDPYGEVRMATRNWCPEFVLDFVTSMFNLTAAMQGNTQPFFFKLTGKI